MGKDLNFNKIIKVLRDIHKEFEDLRFGLVIQTAIDEHKRKHNTDIHNLNSKNVLNALNKFHERTKIKRDKSGS